MDLLVNCLALLTSVGWRLSGFRWRRHALPVGALLAALVRRRPPGVGRGRGTVRAVGVHEHAHALPDAPKRVVDAVQLLAKALNLDALIGVAFPLAHHVGEDFVMEEIELP